MGSISTPCMDAEAHIAQIRHDKGLIEGSPTGHNVSDLENALMTLSDQLYQSSTHFLLELIQNADDNSYSSNVQPSVHFTYSNGGLQVDCNEVGFSPRNVEALCRVGQSTKKGGDNATRYVGEKGIGFKSVFKAADVVWISSGPYSFKFDKRKQLGMIAPIWDAFPAEVKPGFTSFYLQLSDNYNRRGLLDELSSLDSRLLIFLRRLQNITVSISEPFRMTRKSKFSKLQVGKDLIRLVENDNSYDYIVARHQVSNMPYEPKRLGVYSTEIILGFPIDEHNQPRRQSQQAYAFLPIRDYGFEFLIQADFLLIASREDIDGSSSWNCAIRRGLLTAFINTIDGFNMGPLRYTWPRYLPLREPLQSFLKCFHLEILQKLTSHPTLLSQSGTFVAPHKLTHVPEEFTFNGAPMTISIRNSKRYLSASYLPSDMEYLKLLKVQEMNRSAFFSELKSLIEDARVEYTGKSDAWHSHLASILTTLPQSYSTELTELALIPLSDGTWVSSEGRQILFPSIQAEFEFPGGLELSVVLSRAAADPARRKLFKFLGVGDLAEEPIVHHIADLHRNGRARSHFVSRPALISQIHFLYSVGWKNHKYQHFWFSSESGQRLQGSQLYQDSTRPFSASYFFAVKHRGKFQFIHKDYKLEKANDRVGWNKWLEEKMDVATMPRLVQMTSNGGFKLSEDFDFIIKNFPSSDVLMLLRENWEGYSRYFDPDWAQQAIIKDENIARKFIAKEYSKCAKTLKEKLESMLVTCTTGKKHRLGTTFLPTEELVLASQDGVPFVDIPNPNDPHWDVLKKLGVSIKVDVMFYLRSLERLAKSGSDDGIRAEKLLNNIQSRCDTESDIISHFFEAKSLIFVPNTRRGRHKWVSLGQCRWKAPLKDSGSWKIFTCLYEIYPAHRRLFCEVLDVLDACLTDVIKEAKNFKSGDSLTHITSIFNAMSKLLEDEQTDDSLVELKSLKDYKIFPVSKSEVISGQATWLMRPFFVDEWFVADTTPLEAKFRGLVPLLDIKVDDLVALHHLVEKLGLGERMLSKQVKNFPRTQGDVDYNEELTESFRSKVDFIIRLIPTAKHHRQRRRRLIQELRNVKVYTAIAVIQESHIYYKSKWVKAQSGLGHVALGVKDDALEIYLGYKDEPQLPEIELADELFSYCGMIADSPPHSEMCLHVALTTRDTERIAKLFANKGIPTLESLSFANTEESESDEEESEKKKGSRWSRALGRQKSGDNSGEDSERSKNQFRPFGDVSVNEAILRIPISIVVGFGGLLKRRKCFDGKNEGDTLERNETELDSPIKEELPGYDEPQTVSKDDELSEGGPSALKRLGRAVSHRFRQLTTCDEDIAFMGEFKVHEILSSTMSRNYNPRSDWKSHRRARAGFPIMISPVHDEPTFSFTDVAGTFTKFLFTNCPSFAENKDWIDKHLTYHLDVKTTRGPLEEEFEVSQAMMRRTREWSIMVQQMKSDVGEAPRDVCVLVRIYDMALFQDERIESGGKGKGKEESNPKVAFLVDLWDAYQRERLILKPTGGMIGSIV